MGHRRLQQPLPACDQFVQSFGGTSRRSPWPASDHSLRSFTQCHDPVRGMTGCCAAATRVADVIAHVGGWPRLAIAHRHNLGNSGKHPDLVNSATADSSATYGDHTVATGETVPSINAMIASKAIIPAAITPANRDACRWTLRRSAVARLQSRYIFHPGFAVGPRLNVFGWDHKPGSHGEVEPRHPRPATHAS